MLERFLKAWTVILIGCFLLPGCGNLTHSGRQQIAYQRYVKKSMKNRERWRKKIARQTHRVPKHKPSDYSVSTGTADGPQSVASGDQ